MITTIAFDADDTLWHNESIFAITQDRFRELLTRYVPEGRVDERLYETEVRNLRLFGYGVKGFTLSMIETAIEVTECRIEAADIRRIVNLGKAMLEHPVEPLDNVRETIEQLRGSYTLMVITKGDLFDQESKIARSGLGDAFSRVEIVSEKNEEAYRIILNRHGIAPPQFLMVGNSLKSDILPVVNINARAVHIPYHVTWAHEMVDLDGRWHNGYWSLDNIAGLPDLLDCIAWSEIEARPA
jgi:putative hydrolase of the HAD superfamily